MKEFQKYNKTGICVIVSWLFNQYVPDYKIIKGFYISRKNIIVYICGSHMKMRYLIMDICIILELYLCYTF